MKKEIQKQMLFSRSPIFNKDKSVYAYKLNLNFDDFSDENRSSTEQKQFEKELANLLEGAMEILSTEKKIFVNFTESMIESEVFFKFPPEKLGIKLKEDINIKSNKISKRLSEKLKMGYDLLIEEEHLGNQQISDFAEYVGIDFRNKQLCEKIKKQKSPKKTKLIAIGIDSHHDFEEAKLSGFDFFLGNFFLTPDILPAKDIAVYKMNIYKIIKELNRREIEVIRIEKILKTDVSLTVKLLKFINSPKFGIKTKIESIPHALRLLGENEIKNWLLLIVLASSLTRNVEDLVRNTIFRAKFCELLAVNTNKEKKKEQYFLLGMLSMLDVFLSRNLEEILEDFSIDIKIKNALQRKDDNEYSDVLDLVLDYERSEWSHVLNSMSKIQISDKNLGDIYIEALDWSNDIETI